jgi:pimeloyl-ACP methyl ester carboxylesterase
MEKGSHMYAKQLLTLPLSDELFVGQFLRTLAATYIGCADIAECFSTAARTTDSDFDLWHREWTRTATRVREAAEASLNTGHAVSACSAFLRAGEYYRQAAWFLRENLDDPRILQAADDLRSCFQQATRLLDTPVEAVEILYEGTTLNGYFFRPGTTEIGPTLVMPGGYDGFVEETYQSGARAAVERGYNCLAFDGPGQGHVLLRQRLYMRPDFENVIGPVLDWLVARPEVKADKIILMGRSFGGYLAPRAACGERRLAGLVCDPGQISIAAALRQRLPPAAMEKLEKGDADGVNEFFASPMAQNRMTRFFFISRMRVHGVDTVYDFLKEAIRYDLTDRVEAITCPTLVCDNPTDTVSSRGNTFYEALRCEKTLISFSPEEGASGHCEAGAASLFEQRVFDWIDQIIRR